MSHLNSSWRPTLTTIAITSITVTSTYCLYQCVSQYGWEGTFWYIWEGDPYPPQVRNDFHALDDAEKSIQKEARILDRLEEAFQRAKLDSVDGSSESTIVELWNKNLLQNNSNNKHNKNLEKTLAGVSYNLDQYAAQVDAVPSKHHPDLKSRKKLLSNQIVQLMQRADVYMTHYQGGQQPATTQDLQLPDQITR